VTLRSNGKIGFIVEASKANYFTLKNSVHSVDLIKGSPDIYFVYFPNTNMKLPTYASELTKLEV
jgi:hypothetical protein